ncbi:hypothetical protein HCH_02288 [Hahella chejuensis KCTC 2396]|uniref:Uncharacterized protein n=1 Tax=Hahella chejuensis (strain KCTC 2396) TaxID=349521 RepID=Q2SJR3_HAHCH|nr:hypothetical protein HCH_02288 [Hahella chejuensis KCTC 2396]
MPLWRITSLPMLQNIFLLQATFKYYFSNVDYEQVKPESAG